MAGTHLSKYQPQWLSAGREQLLQHALPLSTLSVGALQEVL